MTRPVLKRMIPVAVIATLFVGSALAPGVSAESRIKDIARVEGVRDNDLIGYGLVVGLKGTGDSGGAMFTVQSVANMLMQFGIKVLPDQMRVRNVAAVMVTGRLPAFARVGDRVDVVVSSVGDAKSLEGGTLLLTPLQGPDGKFYAAAQGVISLGGGGGSRQKVHPTVARIPQGATVEQELAATLAGSASGTLTLVLMEPDFVTADRVASAICARLGEGVAKAVDAGAVKVQVPAGYASNLVGLVAQIEEIPVSADVPARVVFNERTGTVVIGGSVRILPAVVSHGSLRVQISGGQPSQGTVAAGQSQGSQGEQAQVSPMPTQAAVPGTAFSVSSVDTVDALVAALNSVGATPRDIIAILQALRACGALLAEIEVL
ncbi:MAG: flagellar basal body P-ring protein FlgI [Bacillota bacterium]